MDERVYCAGLWRREFCAGRSFAGEDRARVMDIGGGMRDIGGSMNRRQFLSSSGAAALALGGGVDASSASTTSSSAMTSKQVLLKLGCQSKPTNDEHLKYLAR